MPWQPTSPGGNALDAALTAMEAPSFYNVTLKNFVTPWTNRDQTVFAPLNDYTATVIGMVRDDVPFNTLLSANILYVGAPGLGLPAYSMTSNAHYQALDDQGIDLKANLVQTHADRRDGPAGRRRRRRDDHAGGLGGLLRRGHQSRDVPLHRPQSPLQGISRRSRTRRCRWIASGRTSRARRAATAASS